MYDSGVALWRAFCQAPNETTFQPVFERTKGLVFTICRRILHDHEEAEDALQMTYCRLLSVAKGVEEAGEFEDLDTFVGMLARREASKRQVVRSRRQKREVAVDELPQVPDGLSPPDQVVSTQESRAKIEEIVGGLPDEFRLPVFLHFFHGLTYRQISSILETPHTTVARRIKRGLDMLRPRMKRLGLGEASAAMAAIAGAAGLLFPSSAHSAAAIFAKAQAGVAAMSVSGVGAKAGWSAVRAGMWGAKAKAAATGAILAAGALLYIGLKAFAPTGESSLAPSVSDTNRAVAVVASLSPTPAPRSTATPLPTGATVATSMKTLHVLAVWSDTREPVEGAQISASLQTWRKESVQSPPPASTDSRGLAAVTAPASWESLRLRIRHPLAADGDIPINPPAPDPIAIELVRGATLFGVVVYEGVGAPAEGAEVQAIAVDRQKTWSAQSNAAGEFEIKGVSGGNTEIAARLGAFRYPMKATAPETIRVEAGARNGPFTLILKKGNSLGGKVRDQANSQPLPGATVTAHHADRDYSATADKDGAYLLEGLPEGGILISAASDGYIEDTRLLELGSEPPDSRDFYLKVGSEIIVQTLDSTGAPIPDADVMATGKLYDPSILKKRRTDREGKTLIRGVDPSDPPIVWAEKEGFQQSRSIRPQFVNVPGPVPVTLEMSAKSKADDGAGMTISGRVTDSAGAPIAQARITWSPYTIPYWLPVWTEEETLTDSAGNYRLNVAEGDGAAENSLSVRASGWAGQELANLQFKKGDVRQYDFVMKPGHYVGGVIVDGQGVPIPGVAVSLLTKADYYFVGRPYQKPATDTNYLDKAHASYRSNFIGEYRRALQGRESESLALKTDSQGRFRFEDIAAPAADLSFSVEGKTPIGKQSLPVDKETQIVMGDAGFLQGEVIDKESGSPVRDFTVKSTGRVESYRWLAGEAFNSPRGEFRIDDLPVGEAQRLKVEAMGYTPSEELQVMPASSADTAPLRILLGKQAEAQARIVQASTGSPLAGIQVLYACYPQRYAFDWSWILQSKQGYVPLSNPRLLVSDHDGLVSIPGIETNAALFVSAPGYAREIVPLKSPAPDADPAQSLVVVALKPEAALTAFSAKADGAAHRFALEMSGAPRVFGQEKLEQPPVGGMRQSSWNMLPAGRCLISDLMAGAGARLGVSLATREISLGEGERRALTFEEAMGPNRLSGRVVNADGPLASAEVHVKPQFSWEYKEFRAFTDSSGAYLIEGLAPGAYAVSVAHPFGGPQMPVTARFTIELQGPLTRDFTLSRP